MTCRTSVLACVVLALLVPTPIAAQSAAAPSGHWEGAIQIPAQELKIEIDLEKKSDTWNGTITIPAQGLKAFPLTIMAVTAGSVSFGMKGVPGNPTFTGTVSKDAKTISGDFSQGGGTVPFTLSRTGDAKIEPLPKSTAITKALEGSWQGSLDIDGKVLRLTLKLSTDPGGAGTGTLISIDQGGAEIPIAAVIQTGAHLKLLLPSIVGTFDGDFKDGTLNGSWTQGPKTWPLVFERTK